MTQHANTDRSTEDISAANSDGFPTIRLGRDDVEVRRLAPEPVKRLAMPRHEAMFIRAFERAHEANLISGTLPHDAVRALSRSIIDSPKAAVARAESGVTGLVNTAADTSVTRYNYSALTLVPGMQPRGAAAGGRPTQVPDPEEDLDASDANSGLMVLTFDDPEHLRRWVADAIARSLFRAVKRGRPADIAATGVRRPISVSMTLIQFKDGTPSQWVPMVADGISRLSVCLAAILGHLGDRDFHAAADTISTTLLPTSSLSDRSNSHDLVKAMHRQHIKYVEDYQDHVDVDGEPDEEGIRLRQFLTLPADVYLLATNSETGEPHPMDSVMQGVVSDTHTDVDLWDAEDQSRHRVIRALTQMLEADFISKEFYDLAVGRAHPATSDDISVPQAGVRANQVLLRRAVTLQASLIGPAHFDDLKRALRIVGGHGSLTLDKVVQYIAPLVCEPWGTKKPMTKAWNYGGPVTQAARSIDLVPVHPADYLTLVDAAMDEDDAEVAAAARIELALAGGTALVADGILTTAVVGGSGGTKNKLAFRGNVNLAIDALTRTREGLLVLATAANAFDPALRFDKARLPQVDESQPDKVLRDGAGKAVPITEPIVAQVAALTDTADTGGEDDSRQESEVEETEEQRVEREAAEAREAMHRAAATLPGQAHAFLQAVQSLQTMFEESNETATGLAPSDKSAILQDLVSASVLVGGLQ